MKRFDSYETIGGLFGEITIGTAELTIVDRVWLLIVEVVTEIAGLIFADYNELMRAAICGNSHLHAMFVHEYAELEQQKFTCESWAIKDQYEIEVFLPDANDELGKN